ncbi:serine hydroxymethyltransferase [Candidatus Dojkabacteria bacterium]|nr:serine hydroxymethyltransferase [Candidatus Dojkabacteria bacterium]
MNEPIGKVDPVVAKLIESESKRQEEGLELIPSENYVSRAVLSALGSVFTNKYSEGYPKRRYYGGQKYTDLLETEVINRAKTLFHCDHANVQPLSGAPANTAAYFAWCNPGDTIMAMDLTHGGHLTHGHPVTHLSRLFKFVRYKIKDIETGEIDYDHLRDTALMERPKIILAGYTSYPRNYNYKIMADIANEVGAVAMADIAHIAGLIAAGVIDNPFDFGFHMVTTTTHKTLRGPRAGLILTRGKVGNPLAKVKRTIENLPTLVDRSVFPGLQGGPHMNAIAAIGVALKEASTKDFKVYAEQVIKNAKVLSTELMSLGCKLVTNGTDNHLMVIDCVKSFEVDGKIVEDVLSKVGLNLNKNVVPDDPLPPYKPSGVRLGTPAMTTRGLKEFEMKEVAELIVESINSRKNETKLKAIKEEVTALCKRFPVY